MKALVSKNL